MSKTIKQGTLLG